MSHFKNKGFRIKGCLNFTPREAYDELTTNEAVLLDVRAPEYCAFKKADVPETILIPSTEIEAFYESLPKSRTYIVADSTGLYSGKVVEFLTGKGYELAQMAGGLIEWERDGMPLKEDIEERLSGSCMCQLRPRNKKK